MLIEHALQNIVEIHKLWDNSHYDYHVTAVAYDVTCDDFVLIHHDSLYEGSQVNAPSHLVERYHAELEAVKRYLRQVNERAIQAIQAAKPTYGKVVRVIKGRKLPKGTVGDVFWSGNNGYGESVGIRLLDGSRVFVSAANVEVVI